MFQQSLLHTLDLVSTIGFAASGTLLAQEQRRRFVPALAYAALTAIGGGTCRDLLLARPVFWIEAPIYLLLAITTGIIFFLFSRVTHLTQQQLSWLDNVGLATFTIIGAQVTLLHPVLVWPLYPAMGLMTAMGGGCLRDLLVAQKPNALNHPQAIFASLMGGTIYSLMVQAQFLPCCAAIIVIPVILLLLPGTSRSLIGFMQHWGTTTRSNAA